MVSLKWSPSPFYPFGASLDSSYQIPAQQQPNTAIANLRENYLPVKPKTE